jgi:hypothetical protein
MYRKLRERCAVLRRCVLRSRAIVLREQQRTGLRRARLRRTVSTKSLERAVRALISAQATRPIRRAGR